MCQAEPPPPAQGPRIYLKSCLNRVALPLLPSTLVDPVQTGRSDVLEARWICRLLRARADAALRLARAVDADRRSVSGRAWCVRSRPLVSGDARGFDGPAER